MRTGTDRLSAGLLVLVAAFVLAACQPVKPPSVAKHKVQVPAAGSRENVRLSPVHFDTGKDVLPSEEKKMLDENVAWLGKYPEAVLVLEGHCDERGGDLFNMELGDRRARRVKADLIERGIEADRLIMVVSYGARKPLDPRHTPEAWDMNRRVEFIVR